MAPPLPGCLCAAVAGRTMATQEVTPGSQSEDSNALDLPSACDMRDYMMQRPSQEAHSEAFSSLETFSFPSSSDVDPDSQRDLQSNKVKSKCRKAFKNVLLKYSANLVGVQAAGALAIFHSDHLREK
ncbi:PREDICTED: uncharacterized protein C20orf196 homolog isoform X5 [Hipposideros armiger]|uniref:Uncharacterized protein C20orf196 homolog isoform X5 n=1 Tax=Hipposideros armiger TaxID=186990 RepID=A0A8B7RLK0_HIPAR|nr:PREDICTED: uncharacterized protein C20orf196 homolog isoform X5 [Hipposideros armiger]